MSMSNIQLVSNKTITLGEVYKIFKIFGTSMEITNLSTIGNALAFLGHVNSMAWHRGVKLITIRRIPSFQLDPDAPRLVKICEDIVHAIRSNTSVINMTSIECNDGVNLPVRDNSFIRAIITNICFYVSMVSLLVLIVVYMKIGMISTIPGSNLENISISFLMSNCLVMFGVGASDIKEGCFVIGVILHHLWLSVFYFMSIATLYTVENLTKLRSNDQKSHSTLKNKKRCLTLGGVIVPCMFVGPAVFLDIYCDTYLSSGFGNNIASLTYSRLI